MSFKPLVVLLVMVTLLAGCISQPPPLPDTPQRHELMERIFAKSTIVVSLKQIDADAAAHPEKQPPPVSADEALATQKKEMNVDLPAAYWQQRREYLVQFLDAKEKGMAAGMATYKEKYFDQLSRAQTPMLAALANAPRMDAMPQLPLVLPNDRQLAFVYMITMAEVAFAQINKYTQDMIDLDAQYNVCAKTKDCFRPDWRTADAKPPLP
ncbi:hypothetical protein [Pseudomonas sp. PB106]|uniref:hypothetical protein n=1 Tax=Pseudomonas sp. PB106 TaxID=2494699 RepID=UPI00131D9527|nr:hypothetical protein [Pseudomonas sp. PB106]KAE9640497.1 hypothetical protein EJA71_22800 [Pseudomonas sp. PB106]